MGLERCLSASKDNASARSVISELSVWIFVSSGWPNKLYLVRKPYLGPTLVMDVLCTGT